MLPQLIIFGGTERDLRLRALQHGAGPELLDRIMLVTPGCDMSDALSLPEGTPWHRIIDWSPDMVCQNNLLWARYGQPVSACKAFARIHKPLYSAGDAQR